MSESEQKKVPVILHYPDFRGDHANDARKVIMVPPDMTVEQLRQRLDGPRGGDSSIEITGVEEWA